MTEIHFYSNMRLMNQKSKVVPSTYCFDWDSTKDIFSKTKAFLKEHKNNSEILSTRIYTNQMALLRDAWVMHFEYGVKIFMHDKTGTYEICETCERTEKDLRREHDIFKLWIAGSFAKKVEKEKGEEE